MIEEVPIPMQCLSVASVSRVVKASMRQLGHPSLPIITAGTMNHDVLNKIVAFLFNNLPMKLVKLQSYLLYNKK